MYEFFRANIGICPFNIFCCAGTLMCYGQTGAGKTFTMTGATENYKHRGIIPRALAQLYKEIDERPDYAISVRFRLKYHNVYRCLQQPATTVKSLAAFVVH